MRQLKPRITKRTNAGGTISYCVDAGLIDGKRHRRFYATKKEAEVYADQVKQAKAAQGALAFSLTSQQQVDALRAFERLQFHDLAIPLTDVVEFYLLHNKPKNGKKLVSEVIAEFIKTRVEAAARPRYLKALRCAYGKFNETFAQKFINEITRPEVEQWLGSLVTVTGSESTRKEEPYSPQTRINYLRDLGMLFKFAKEEGYCAENVIQRIRKPNIADKPVEILSVGEATLLVSAAHQFEDSLLPYIAIGLFAGLRSSELETLDWNEISLHNRRIEVTAEKSKTARRRIVEISENLYAWLSPYAKMSGPIVSLGWRDRLQKLAKLAEFKKWPRNALRHSFGSYHYAQHESADKTAKEMGHESTKMLFAHYREVVTREQAEQYWNIFPPDKNNMMRTRPSAEKTISQKDLVQLVRTMEKASGNRRN